MKSTSTECARQLRKRPKYSQQIIHSSRIRKFVYDYKFRKSVDLFDKYLPFFLEQHNLLNELRSIVRERVNEKTAAQENIPNDNSPAETTQMECQNNEEDNANGNVIDCQIAVEDDLDSSSDDMINCKLSDEHSLTCHSVDVELEVPLDSANAVPCSSLEDDIVSAAIVPNSDSSPTEISSGNNEEATCGLETGESSQNEVAVLDCRTPAGDTHSVLSDDAIDCELLREDFQDSERLSEDSVEYNILYVSENPQNDSNIHISNVSSSYQLCVNDATDSELSFDSDPASDPAIARSATIPSILHLIDNMGPTSSDQQHTNCQSPTHTADLETLIFPCQFCTSLFKSSADLDCHLNTHRGTVLPVPSAPTPPPTAKSKPSPNMTIPRYHCNVCFRPYTTSTGLKYHLRYHHNLNLPPTSSPDSPNSGIKRDSLESNTSISRMPKPSYKCFYCPRLVYSKTSWLDHFVYHKINREYYSCPQCEFRIWHVKLIIYHIGDQHKEYFDSHFLNHPNTSDIAPHLTPRLSRAIQGCASLAEVPKLKKFTKSRISLKSKIISKRKWKRRKIPFVKSRVSSDIVSTLPTFEPEVVKASCSPDYKGSNINFNCLYCDLCFLDKHQMYSHLHTHINTLNNLYYCPVCSYTYKVPWFLVKHFLTSHQESVPRPKQDSDNITTTPL